MAVQKPNRTRGASRGDSLLTAAVLMMIVCLVVVLIMPALQQKRNGGRSPLKNNAKQLGLGVHNFSDTFQHLPPLRPEGGTDSEVDEPISFFTSLLPFMEHPKLYKAIDTGIPWDDPANRQAYATTVPEYLAPRFGPSQTPAGYGITHFSPNSRILSMEQPARMEDLVDGAAQTILLGTIDETLVPAWGDPANQRDPARGFGGGPHAYGGLEQGGAIMLFADGNAHYLSPKTDPKVAKALATPDGGETVSNEDY